MIRSSLKDSLFTFKIPAESIACLVKLCLSKQSGFFNIQCVMYGYDFNAKCRSINLSINSSNKSTKMGFFFSAIFCTLRSSPCITTFARPVMFVTILFVSCSKVYTELFNNTLSKTTPELTVIYPGHQHHAHHVLSPIRKPASLLEALTILNRTVPYTGKSNCEQVVEIWGSKYCYLIIM